MVVSCCLVNAIILNILASRKSALKTVELIFTVQVLDLFDQVEAKLKQVRLAYREITILVNENVAATVVTLTTVVFLLMQISHGIIGA